MTSDTDAAIAAAEVLKKIVGESGGIIRELLKAGMSSNIIGFATVMIIVDLLEKQAKILSSDTALLIKGVTSSMVGVSMASSVIASITDLTHIFGDSKNPTVTDLPQVLVIQTGGEQQSALPLLKNLLPSS